MFQISKDMISVIIPIYNAAQHLPRMLHSLETQSAQSLEIILIDDGSTDASADICKTAEQHDARIHYFYQKNAGVSAARNYALSLANGEYISFLDADDAIDPNYFSELLLACHSADIAVCDVVIKTRTGEALSRFTAGNETLTSQQAINFLLSRKKINSGPCGKLFRRSIVEGLHFPALKAYEDILFVKDAFFQSAYIASTSSTAYHYYQNAGGAMAQQKRSPSLDIVIATEELLKFISQHKELDATCLYITISHLYQYVLSLDTKDATSKPFREAVRQLYQKYWKNILFCRAFPGKEKILYSLFTWNLL